MFHFQSLDVAEGGRFGKDERRFFVTARGSAFECAAVLDAMIRLGIADARISTGHALATSDRLDVDEDDRIVAYAYAYAYADQLS